MSDQKNLYCLHLERSRFNQEDCKRFHKSVHDLKEFSHKENRRFYFECTPQYWDMLQKTIRTMNKNRGNEFDIKTN